MRTPSIIRLCAVALTAALTGCGGAPTPPPPTAERIEVMPVDPTAAARLVSAYRKSLGLSAVTLDPALIAVAQRQADAMASANELSHEVAGSLSKRLRTARLPDGYAVENVSAGYATLETALAGWRHSPGHDANLRDPRMRRLGIAAAEAPDTHYKTFWSLDMTD